MSGRRILKRPAKQTLFSVHYFQHAREEDKGEYNSVLILWPWIPEKTPPPSVVVWHVWIAFSFRSWKCITILPFMNHPSLVRATCPSLHYFLPHAKKTKPKHYSIYLLVGIRKSSLPPVAISCAVRVLLCQSVFLLCARSCVLHHETCTYTYYVYTSKKLMGGGEWKGDFGAKNVDRAMRSKNGCCVAWLTHFAWWSRRVNY